MFENKRVFCLRKFLVVEGIIDLERKVTRQKKKFRYKMFKVFHSRTSLFSVTHTVKYLCPVQIRVFATV
jgi:hypothetical protein